MLIFDRGENLRSLAILEITRLGWRVVFPLTEPRKPPGRKSPKKWEKITKFPSPVQPPKMGKNYQNITKKYSENAFFCNFSVVFPHFRGLDRGGEFCNFFPFFGDFRPGGFRGSVRGKTTRKSWGQKGSTIWRGAVQITATAENRAILVNSSTWSQLAKARLFAGCPLQACTSQSPSTNLNMRICTCLGRMTCRVNLLRLRFCTS